MENSGEGIWNIVWDGHKQCLSLFVSQVSFIFLMFLISCFYILDSKYTITVMTWHTTATPSLTPPLLEGGASFQSILSTTMLAPPS